MPVVARGSGESASEITSHVIGLPGGILAGDAILVVFTQQHATQDGASADTSSTGWAKVAEDWNGTSTNVRGTVFWCANSAAGGSPLTITTTTNQTATWLVYVIRNSTGDIYVTSDNGGADTAADIAPNTGRPTGDYVHVVALGVDSNTDGFVPHITDPPSGYTLTEVTPADNTADSVSTLAVDGELEDVTGASTPATLTYSTGTQEQWVSFNILIGHTPGPLYDTLRLYLTSRGADAATAGATMGFWNDTPAGSTASPRLLGTAPAGALVERGVPEAAAVDGYLVLVQQFVSGPATADGELPLIDWSLVVAAYQSAAGADMRPALGAWIMGTDGQKRQELVGVAGGPTTFPVGSDIDDALGIGIVTNFTELGGSTLPQAIFTGERIVVEIGYVSYDEGADDPTEYTGTILYGGTATPDLAPGDVAPNLDRPAWLEIAVSPGLTFTDPAATAGTAAAELGFTATAVGRRRPRGTAAAELGFTATAAGVPIPDVPGTAAAELGFTATATGTALAPGRGTAAAELGFTAVAVGRRNVSGTAVAELGFTAAGRSRLRRGVAAAELGFTAAAVGDAMSGPVGTAAAELGFLAVATGTRDANAGVPFLVDEFGPAAKLRVEIAWGADPAGDPADWVWTDITRDVYRDPGITTRMGRDDEASMSQPASCTFVLRNDHGAYSLGGHSPNWPHVKRNVPVRVRIRPGATGLTTLFIGHVDGFTPGWATSGRIPTVEVSASGAMRRILQGDAPVTSAYRRAMTALNSVVAYWPFEDGKNSAYAAAVRGGENMVTATDSHEFAASDVFDCSAPLVRLRSSPAGTFEDFGATVDPYPVTGQTQVRWLMSFPRDGLPNGAFLADVFTNGSAARWSVTYWDGLELDPADFLDPNVRDPIPGGELHGVHLTIWDDDNNVIEENLMLPLPIRGVSVRLSLDLIQEGSDVRWRVGMLEPGEEFALYHEGVLEAQTVGRVESLFMGGNDVDDVTLGHVTLQNQVTDLFEESDPLSAFTGEFSTTVGGRLNRLARENGVQISVFGFGSVSGNETLGPQLARPLMELLRECEVTDQGQLYDGIRPGLIYTTRRYREQGVVALTIDAAAGELAEPFAPIDDDQRNRNRVQATITTGVTATFEDRLGPLGTDEIGIYDDSVEVNNEHDDMAIHYAAWLVHLGTHPGYRVGSVTVDLRAAPHLAGAVLAAVPGERIDIVNLDQVVDGWLPGDVPLSLIIEGIAHDIGPRHWRCTFRCSPFSPWGVARAAADVGDTSEFAWRLDTDGTRLVGAHPAGSTSLTVSTDPVELATDGFDRTVSNGWGTAPVGGPWTVAGTSGAQVSDFSVASGTGRIAVQATNRAQYAYLEQISERDVDVAVTCTCSATDIAGTQLELADVMVRGRSPSSYTYARVIVLADESVWLSIVEVVDNEHTELAQPLEIPGLTFTGTLRCRMQAEGHTLRARVWDPAGPEPDEWQREITVTAARPGWVGVRVAVNDGITNTLPLVFSHDDFVATTLAPAGGPLWTTDADDYPMRLSVGGIPVVATACTGETNPQTFTVEPLPLDRPDRAPVALWDPRPVGL